MSLLFMVPISLTAALVLMFFYISTFRSMCAVTNMAIFCSSLNSWCPGMVLTYFLNDFEVVLIAPIITGITLVFTFHTPCISILRSLYIKIFLRLFLNHIPVSWNYNIYQHASSLFIISYSNVCLVMGNGPVSLYVLVPQYGYLTSST
jgi:hypothetical protein